MALIRVTPEDLRGVAGQFKGSHDEAQAMIQKLASTVSNLDANWDGMASQRFYQNFELWQRKMGEFTGLLDEISHALTEIAERFEQADMQTGGASAGGRYTPVQ
ncbi:MAG TPA: WXG100 family type VII secretion target [Symbiobacteriaceae bacterium]|nr:WXG100 family type VII secretion target [Symbiobacteriaceae bacterium]